MTICEPGRKYQSTRILTQRFSEFIWERRGRRHDALIG
jgi:hypothetical protein